MIDFRGFRGYRKAALIQTVRATRTIAAFRYCALFANVVLDWRAR